MYLQFLRILLIVLLIFVAVADPVQFTFALAKEWQYIIAISILITVLFVDVISGFILAIVLATIFVKLYDVRFKKTSTMAAFDESVLDYITPENLREAQSNVINENVFDKEYIGIKGVYGEEVYGAQGLSELKPGYSRELLTEEPMA